MSEASFNELLASLDVDGLANVDPIAFAYARGLLRRICSEVESESSLNVQVSDSANKPSVPVSRYVKAREAATNYLAMAEQQKQKAKAGLESLSAADEFVQQQAQELFQSYRFRQLERLIKRYETRGEQQARSSLLDFQKLLAEMNQSAAKPALDDEQENAKNIEQLLDKQEQYAKVDSGELNPELQNDLSEQLELRSMKFFRESMKHYDIDKTIARAIFEEPQNPGPLNPHMIAIKGLTKMQNLSPDYLRRFAAYIETLLWLEKNLNKLSVVPKI